MADRQMFVDAIAQGLALIAPHYGDSDAVADRLVHLIGVWVPAPSLADYERDGTRVED